MEGHKASADEEGRMRGIKEGGRKGYDRAIYLKIHTFTMFQVLTGPGFKYSQRDLLSIYYIISYHTNVFHLILKTTL